MRVTDRHLEMITQRINELTGSPTTAYTKKPGGGMTGNVGHFMIDRAYGGNQLQRMHTEGGGVTTPLGGGYCTKRELYEKLHAFAEGIEFEQTGKVKPF